MALFEVEIVGHPASLKEKNHPRDSAIYDIGVYGVPYRPALRVSDADGWVEQDPRAAVGNPIAELDVFDAGPVEPLVESSGIKEYTAAHAATPAPEGESTPVGVPMHITVGEVSVLRAESWIPRGVIIRPDNGCKCGVMKEVTFHHLEGVRVNAGVGIKKRQKVAFGSESGVVSACGGSHVGVHHNDLCAKLPGNVRTIIGGTIIYDYKFIGRARARLDSNQSSSEQPA